MCWPPVTFSSCVAAATRRSWVSPTKHGTLEAPIRIRCHVGETVLVDGFEPADIAGERAAFRTVGNDERSLIFQFDRTDVRNI
jgi:hypothetical protein